MTTNDDVDFFTRGASDDALARAPRVNKMAGIPLRPGSRRLAPLGLAGHFPRARPALGARRRSCAHGQDPPRRGLRVRPDAHARAVRGRAHRRPRSRSHRRAGRLPSRRPAHPTGGKHAKLSAPVDASSDATAAPRPSIARWARDACVLLLRFPSAAAQRDALGRASVFLEDLDDASRVVDRLPSGQRGGVANYSGHNMRLGDLARFDAACRAANKPLWPAERALVEALVDAGALAPRGASGALRVADRRPGFEPCVAAVARSSDKAEVRDALLHEAMHMVFYRDERYAARCLEWWRSEATDAERDAWIAFLRNLRYDVANEELVVNELQAYMCTERAMFGGFGGFGENKGGVGSGGGGRRRERGGGGWRRGPRRRRRRRRRWRAMQRRFAAFAAERLEDAPSVGASVKVVWER